MASGQEAGGMALEKLPRPTKAWCRIDATLGGGWAFHVWEVLQCFFEGGKSCRREDPARQGTKPALRGVHSDWVGEDFLAMARPAQSALKEHEVVQQFRQNGLTCIVNLEEVGEHPGCGPGVLPDTGFSYRPEDFMAQRVSYYNLSWQDMTAPSLPFALSIVHVIDYEIRKGGKVAVHCHAGLGRTGLVIACYLVYAGRMGAGEAIDFIRSKRKGAIQTKYQQQFVHIFAGHLEELRRAFWDRAGNLLRPPARAGGSLQGTPRPTFQHLSNAVAPEHLVKERTLGGCLARQRMMLHGEEARRLRNIPQVVDAVVSALRANARTAIDQAGHSVAEEILSCTLEEPGASADRPMGGGQLPASEASPDEVSAVEELIARANAGDYAGVGKATVRVVAWFLVAWARGLEGGLAPSGLLNAARGGVGPMGPTETGAALAASMGPHFEVVNLLSVCVRECAAAHVGARGGGGGDRGAPGQAWGDGGGGSTGGSGRGGLGGGGDTAAAAVALTAVGDTVGAALFVWMARVLVPAGTTDDAGVAGRVAQCLLRQGSFRGVNVLAGQASAGAKPV